MAFLNFPSNPTTGTIHTIGAKSWTWTGYAWALQPGTAVFSTLTVETLLVTSTANSTSTTTGAVQVAGGVGIAKDAYIGGDLTVNGVINGVIAGVVSTATDIVGGTAGQILYQISSGDTGFFGPGNYGELAMSTGGTQPVFTSTSGLVVGAATTSTNLAGGSQGSVPYQSAEGTTEFISIGVAESLLQSNGTTATFVSTSNIRVGFATTADVLTGIANTATNIENGSAGQLIYQISPSQTGFVSTSTAGYVLISDGVNSPQWQNSLNLSSTTSATSTNTGALTIAGGVGIAGDLYLGGDLYTEGSLVITTATFANSLSEGDDISITDLGGGTLRFDNTSTLQTVTNRGATTTNVLHLTNATESTSTITGALVVSGGIGVGKRITCESIRITDSVFDSTQSIVNDTSLVIIDQYDIGQYRAAKYLIQIDDGTGTNARFHMTEISIIASNTGTITLTEYGTVTTEGTLGVFTANVISGEATLYFQPDAISDKVIYALRTAIAT